MESEGSALVPALLLRSVQLSPAPGRGQRARETTRPRPPTGPPLAPGSTAYRERSTPLPAPLFPPTDTLLPPCGRKRQLHLHLEPS